MTVATSPTDIHFERLREKHDGALLNKLLGGTALVKVPSIPLPEGWNAKETSVWFVVPIGYPMAQPDCFWADSTLRLANGAMPQNTGLNVASGATEEGLWFSWHVASWNALTDDLLIYLRVIRNRFAKAS